MVVERALTALEDKESEVRASSVVTLDYLFTKTDLKSEEQITRKATNRCIDLLDERGTVAIMNVVLRALERFVTLTVVRADEEICRKAVKKVLNLADDDS